MTLGMGLMEVAYDALMTSTQHPQYFNSITAKEVNNGIHYTNNNNDQTNITNINREHFW